MADTPIGFTEVNFGDFAAAGFTNRHGGVSVYPYDSLNLGPNVQDDPDAVAINRRRVGAALGAPIVFSTQIHGADLIQIDDDAAQPWLPPNPPVTAGSADALVTTSNQVGLGVLVADCVPVLIAVPPNGSKGPAVATAHAGRRGVELNVVSKVVERLRAHGADPILAAIGPAICGDCYEVPEQMRAEVAAVASAAWAQTRAGTPGLDLPAAVNQQLDRLGIKVIYRSPVCTLEHDDCYSHRRATALIQTGGPGQTGRQAGVIRLL